MVNLVKEYRKKRGFSQARLAEESDCGLNQNQISQIERGELVPSLSQKEAIADALDAPVRVIFLGEGRIESADEEPDPEDKPEEKSQENPSKETEAPDIHEIRASCNKFANQMARVLIKHVGEKEGWKDEGISYLLERLREEFDECIDAAHDVDEQLLYNELIDVANFCMMICEILATRPNSRVI
jgi:transcriptional regulator with XRE-family HTH domain